MKTNELERRQGQIQKELSELGPMHPGSLSAQYNVCGTPGCRCKDAKKPKKHGPYWNLSYTWRGRSHTLFVRSGRLKGMRERIANYKRFRKLTGEWVDLSIERERLEREATERG